MLWDVSIILALAWRYSIRAIGHLLDQFDAVEISPQGSNRVICCVNNGEIYLYEIISIEERSAMKKKKKKTEKLLDTADLVRNSKPH